MLLIASVGVAALAPLLALPLSLALPLTLALCLPGPAARAQATDSESIVMASTTSTEQSGLFAYLLPKLTAATGIEVKVVAVGTGQALDLARRGDADMLLVHDPKAEQKFIEEGFGVARSEVMYNDFIIIGPKQDPARVGGMKSTVESLDRIASSKAPFISRGDKSGTHGAELRLWQAAGVKPPASGTGWYEESGSGMGPTLNIASAKNAYTLADRGTWLNFRNRGDLVDPGAGRSGALQPVRGHPDQSAEAPARETGGGEEGGGLAGVREGQQTIADYKLNGEPLFFPNAGRM